MSAITKQINKFLAFKLPSAYLCGVRLKSINQKKAIVTVRYRWINQNPFNSMYFAVQSMASELSTGALMIAKIKESGKKISMLVTHHQGEFTKKAVGKITFSCSDGGKIDDAIRATIKTGEGQKVSMKSVGIDEDGDVVSNYTYEWSIRIKSNQK